MPEREGTRPPPSRDVAGEEFLFHLYRGSELLQDNRVHEAKTELENALARKPADPKGQDLLAIVYFRLGMYPRAIAIYEALVENGEDAVAAALAERFDVVLMDVMMPGMGGLEATRRLRQLPAERVGRPWIIAMSAGALPDERRRCQEAGMDDFLCKPAWLEDLEAALLRAPQQGPAALPLATS